MKRTGVLTGVLLAACGAVAPALAADRGPARAAEAAPAAAVAPPTPKGPTQSPALQALAQKMARVRFNTARVSVRSVLGDFNPFVEGEPATGSASHYRLTTTVSAVLSYSPYMFAATSKLHGTLDKRVLHRKLTERLIGRSLYFDIPSLAPIDGGRPWVRKDGRSLEPRDGREPLPAIVTAFGLFFLAVPRPAEHGTFAGLSEALSAAQNVHEITSLTPLTVDGQRVAGFTASIPTARLFARRVSHGRPRPPIATAKPDEEPAALEVFIAPNGVPVRTTIALESNGEGVVIQEDVLALEAPVVVVPPPADRMITQARLEKLESKCRPKRKTPRGRRSCG